MCLNVYALKRSLINGSNRTQFAWKSIQNNGIFDIITNGMKCFMLIVTILWLCLKLKSGHVHQETSLNGIIINSNLASLPENLCCIWTAANVSYFMLFCILYWLGCGDKSWSAFFYRVFIPELKKS